MKFTPRRLRENVNVSPDHPLKEFLVLAGGILGTLLALYLVLGWALDLVVPRIGPEFEAALGEILLPGEPASPGRSPAERRLQEVLDGLVSVMGDDGLEYRVHLEPSDEANAMALPGGHIVVLGGLVREAASENEIAMVLGHELGHFRNRDHLRGLGRGLVLVFLASLLPGADSPASSLASVFLSGARMSYSRQQELAADRWGLDLLMGTYGHAGGATDFFRRLSEREAFGELTDLFASHPFPGERVEAMERVIASMGAEVGPVLPLDGAFLDAPFFEGED